MSEVVGTYARESPYLDRYVQVGIANERVVSMSFPTTTAADSAHDWLDRIFEYLESASNEFEDIEIALTVPPVQCAVLETVRGIPYGEQTSVERLTRRVANFDADSDDDHNRVRTALDANPVPLLIPDHRVRDGPSAAPPKVEQKLRSLEGL